MAAANVPLTRRPTILDEIANGSCPLFGQALTVFLPPLPTRSKHARATTISIALTEDNGSATIRIVDDGIGIPDATTSDGLGLRIMRYRAASIGARFSIEPEPDAGTTVVCTLRRPPAFSEPKAS